MKPIKKTQYAWVVLLSFFFTPALSFTIPPGIPEDNAYIKMGYLDVTLYGADPTGQASSTAEIRKAIKTAQEYQLVCYFPSGTYLVDDSLNCFIPVRPNPKYTGGKGWPYPYISKSDYPVTLVGAVNPRPVIRLAREAEGFDDPENPKPVFWLWAQNRGEQHPETAGSTNPLHQQSNIAFDMVVQNFIIDLGGNKGAEGVRFAGAQGSVVEDVTVLAHGAYAGFHACVGQGGGLYNIEVVGGRHGMVITDASQSKFPVVAGAVFKDQQEEVFKLDDIFTPMAVVGFYIEKKSGPVSSGWPRMGMSLIDGVVKYTDPGQASTVFQGTGHNLFMKNVYINGKRRLMSDDAEGSLLREEGWNHIIEYTHASDIGKTLVNGIKSVHSSAMHQQKAAGEAPSESYFRKKHTWDPAELLHIGMMHDPDFINVEDPSKYKGPGAPEAANGGDGRDDTEAIQWAIDHYKKVFIPKGTFLTSAPLRLGSETQIRGAGKTYTTLLAADNWKHETHTMIKTPADAAATTQISFLNLRVNVYVHHDMNRIDWRTGKRSMIKDMNVTSNIAPEKDNKRFATLKITGPTSGGRIYAWGGHGDGKLSSHPGFRDILVDGSRQGLRFYGVNTESSYSDVQFEVKDSKDVSIFYFKAESGGGNAWGGITHASVPIRFVNSEKILYTCTTGNIVLDNKKAIAEVENCKDITISNIKSFFDVNRNNKEWYLVRETCKGKTYAIKADRNIRLVSFSRD